MEESPGKTSFSEVDRAVNPNVFTKCLEDQYAAGGLQFQKQRTLELCDVQSGQKVLDAGCGIGLDATRMAVQVGDGGRVIAADKSRKMLQAAITRPGTRGLPLTFLQADIYKLSFHDDSFDRCRCVKTFQHLANPRLALRELIRVSKPGGKIITADPDHDLLMIDTPYNDINQRFVQYRSRNMAKGGIAHQMYGLFRDLGLKGVHVELITTGYK